MASFRLLWGAGLLLAPRVALRVLGGTDEPKSRVVVRVLGSRQVVQGALELGAGRSGRELGAVVDVAHAFTAVALGALDRRWRRPALVDACVASFFAAWGWRGRQGR